LATDAKTRLIAAQASLMGVGSCASVSTRRDKIGLAFASVVQDDVNPLALQAALLDLLPRVPPAQRSAANLPLHYRIRMLLSPLGFGNFQSSISAEGASPIKMWRNVS
jgi:hypothetical protein